MSLTFLKKVIPVCLIVLAVPSFAQSSERIRSLDESQSSLNVAQVQKQFTLKATSGFESTRVSLVVMDNGGSTDVSPFMNLYLVFFQDGESSNTSAVFHVASTFKLVDFSDNGQGRLEMENEVLSNTGIVRQRSVINYSDFLAYFEHEARTIEEEFVDEWVEGELVKHNLDDL